MGRGRVQLKRIENKINRQVTFSKRRSGLVKKANEISVLCDADVALIIFSPSPRGKLYHYATDSSMERILERYERYSYAEEAPNATDHPQPQGNWCHEYGKLKARVEALLKSHRHLMGEQLDSLNIKQLQHLEQQLESSLKIIRSRENQLLFNSVAELQKQEESLQEENKLLEKELIEMDKSRDLTQRVHWEQQNQPQRSSSSPPSFLVSNSLPTLNIGTYQGRGTEEEDDIAAQHQVGVGRSLLPPWMLRQMN